MIIQNLFQLLLKVSSNVQCQTHKLFQIISAEDCCSAVACSQQDIVILHCAMCLTPSEMAAGLPSPVLRHRMGDDEAFMFQAVVCPQEATDTLSREPSTLLRPTCVLDSCQET